MQKYFEQSSKYTCGPACARMMLHDIGIEKSEEELCDIFDTDLSHGTNTNAWHNLEDICEVITGYAESLEELEELRKSGWELSVILLYRFPHYLRYRGLKGNKVLYWNPSIVDDVEMNKREFIDRWYIDTDLYFEIAVINGTHTVMDKWYVGIREKV